MGEFILLLANVTLQVNNEDRWLWTLESSHSFTVRSLYHYLTIQPQVELPVDVSSIWLKDVPLKVVVFVWRLFRDRLPTKDNLLRRGVINHDSRLCVAGCDFVESSPHLFLHCNIFGSVWHLIYSWIWILVTNPFSLALVVESERSGAQFYRLYGMQLSRKSGRKETIGYLQAKKAPFFRWWIGLSPSPICG